MAGETEFTANLLDERPHVFKMAKTSPVALGHSFVFDNIFVVKETLSLMLFKKKKRKNNHGQKEENIFFQTTAARGVGSPRGGGTMGVELNACRPILRLSANTWRRRWKR